MGKAVSVTGGVVVLALAYVGSSWWLGQQAENEFVGCRCGIMDQFISALGKDGHALLIDCRSLETETAAIPDELRVMIIDSKVQRGLVGSEYTPRREQCPGKRGKPRQHGSAQALETGGARLTLQPFMQEIHVNA